MRVNLSKDQTIIHICKQIISFKTHTVNNHFTYSGTLVTRIMPMSPINKFPLLF